MWKLTPKTRTLPVMTLRANRAETCALAHRRSSIAAPLKSDRCQRSGTALFKGDAP
jgi:hypothetical protein